MDGVDGHLLNEMVSFFYTGRLEVNDTNVREYLNVALKYELKLLQQKCVEFRCGQISIGNCIDWLTFANENHLQKLCENAFHVVCKEFENISSPEMCKMDFENFEEVIKSDRNTASEEVIFDRLVQWIAFDEMDRSKHASDLLQSIRLEHISTKVFK